MHAPHPPAAAAHRIADTDTFDPRTNPVRHVPEVQRHPAEPACVARPISMGTVAILSRIFRCGNSPAFWMTYPMPRRSSVSLRRRRRTADQDSAARWLDHSIDHPQGGGFSTTRRAHKNRNLSGFTCQIHRVDAQRSIGIAFAHFFKDHVDGTFVRRHRDFGGHQNSQSRDSQLPADHTQRDLKCDSGHFLNEYDHRTVIKQPLVVAIRTIVLD